MQAIPLSREDRSILDLERGNVVGHTCKVIVAGSPTLEVAELREAMAERLPAAPSLTRKLADDRGEPCWIPAHDFDISQHVGTAAVEQPLTSEGLQREIGQLFAKRLDRDRPLWRLDVLPLHGDRTALAWRIHHALADGTACLRFATAVLLRLDSPEEQGRHTDGNGDGRGRRHPLRALERGVGFAEREFGGSRGRSPFDAPIGKRREVAFAAVELEPLRSAAKELAGATVNDAVLAVFAGGIRRWLEHHHGGSLGSLRVKVPVSLHHGGDDVANRDSSFSLPIPIGEPDAVSRLRSVRAATAERKEAHDAQTMDSLLRELARVSPRLERLCERIQASPRRFAVTISNVRGPSCGATVIGRRVEGIHSLAEIRLHHALRIATLSFSGRLWFGLCADPDVVEGLGEMASGVEAEAADLIARGRGRAPRLP